MSSPPKKEKKLSPSKLGDEDIIRIVDQTSHGLAQDHVFSTKVIWGIIKIVLVTAVLSYLTLLGGGYYVVHKYTQSADQTVSNRIYSAMVEMTNKITAEFETARIKETVEGVARGEAKSILISNVQPVVETFRADVENKLAAIDESVKKGNATVVELQTYIVFSKTASAAQNDDRRAFDQLDAWANDTNYPFATEALQTWTTILDAHTSPLMAEGFTIPWSEGVDPSKLSLEQLKSANQQAPPQLRVAMLEYVWKKRTDLPKRDRMQFLADALRNDSSLRVVEYAGRYFAAESKTKLKPLAIKQHLEWWEKNKDSIQ